MIHTRATLEVLECLHRVASFVDDYAECFLANCIHSLIMVVLTHTKAGQLFLASDELIASAV
jgi:hypothetical protein